MTPNEQTALDALKALFRRIKHSIEWPRKRQFELLRSIIGQDQRWMAHDPIVRTLTKRYLGIMREDWEHEAIVLVDQLREDLGLNPWKKAPTSVSGTTDAVIESLDRAMRRLELAVQGNTSAQQLGWWNGEMFMPMSKENEGLGSAGFVSAWAGPKEQST